MDQDTKHEIVVLTLSTLDSDIRTPSQRALLRMLESKDH